MAIPGPRTPLVARIRGGLARWRESYTGPRGSRRIELETPPHAVPAVRTVHLDRGVTDAPEEYKVSKHPPKNKQETIREALLIFGVAVQSVAVASRMIACTCTKTVEIEPIAGPLLLTVLLEFRRITNVFSYWSSPDTRCCDIDCAGVHAVHVGRLRFSAN